MKSMDQSDFQKRLTFANNLEISYVFDSEPVNNDDVYREKYRDKIESYITLRDTSICEDDSLTPPHISREPSPSLVHYLYVE